MARDGSEKKRKNGEYERTHNWAHHRYMHNIAYRPRKRPIIGE